MNNGKVRIYELSRELNLDNKDILEICEQLNIAVKTHSSTITESEATRIRVAAEKYTPSHPANKSDRDTHNDEDRLTAKSSQPAPEKRKQQILAIHHKNNTPNYASALKQPEKNSASVLASPPQLPIKPSSTTSESTVEPTETTADQPSLQLKDNSPALLNVKPQSVKPEEQVKVTSNVVTPKLISPPTRPSKSAPSTPVASSAPREERAFVKPSKSPELKVTAPEPKVVASKTQEIVSKTEKTETRKPPSLNKEAKILPKLQRPKPPKPPQELKSDLKITATEPELDDAEESEELIDEVILDKDLKAKPKLKRPEPPKKSKDKAKIWEDEEEESAEGKAKSKVAKGAKRRKPLVDDDEDDLDLDRDTDNASASISLSMARPPKPASLIKQPVASAVKAAKKPTPKSETTHSRSKTDRRERQVVAGPPEQINISDSDSLTIRELAEMLNTPETDIIKGLFLKGIAVSVTQTLDIGTVRLVAEELGVKVETSETESAATKSTEMLDAGDLENLQRRPPVVTIMGHVDHGKTTLLDSIRKTKVAQGEAGGITQHIGAYHVDVEHEGNTQQVVFLDTPGHEAFTAMRARGARVTDIAILVVAADDGVQPQTKEAISHAKAAGVPIIVAINKVDKPEANQDRIKQELTEQGLLAEEWGGDTIMVPVSALKGENLDELLEMILLVSDMEELSANPDRLAKGTVIEANLDRARGPVATLLVQNGTLRVGDSIVAGSVFGKIRAMIDDRGEKVEAASPSFAVEILGLNEVPAAGDEFDVFASEREARAIADQRAENQRQSRLQQAMASRRITLSSISEKVREGELKELNLILKADVQGSVEAILGSLQQLPQNEVQIRVLLAAPGEITETDVDLAAASGAVIVGFNTTLASGSRSAADREGVDIRQYNIIYNLFDDIQGAMEGLLDPEEVEETLGQAEVRAMFAVGRGTIAGCYVQSGKVVRNSSIRIRRGGQVIYQGALDSLKRFKEDAREVNTGFECGIGSNKFNDWKEGDSIEAYQMVLKRRTLSAK